MEDVPKALVLNGQKFVFKDGHQGGVSVARGEHMPGGVTSV